MDSKEISAADNKSWIKFNVSIPYKEGLNYTGIQFYILGMCSGDRVFLRNFGMDADGVNIDDYIGKSPLLKTMSLMSRQCSDSTIPL